jgi:hypothetical protein
MRPLEQTSGQLLTRAKYPLMQLLIVLPERMPDQHFASVGILHKMVQERGRHS